MKIYIDERHRNGNATYYVLGEAAAAISNLTGKMDVSLSNLSALKALGFEIQRAPLELPNFSA
jgi:hypothetical protein